MSGSYHAHRLLARGLDEGDDVRRGLGVDVLMRDDLEPLADHPVKRLRRVHQLDSEFHRLALKPAPDALLHRADAGHRGKPVLGVGDHRDTTR